MKRFLKLIVGIVFGISVLFLVNHICTYLFVDDTNSQSRITLHEMYTSKENIDVLFLGSSHCMRTIDCEEADAILGKNTFNCGTSSQQLDGSYAMLVEAGKYNELQDVWVELYYGQLGRPTKERTEMTATYILSDYMKPSFNKIRFLIGASSSEYYANSFLPVRRSWQKVFEEGYVKNLLNTKSSDSYKNYAYVGEYKGKGFVGSSSAVQAGTYSHKGTFWTVEPITTDDKENLQKIMAYCEKNNIRLHFFSAPMSDFRLQALGNYDQYVSEISDYLSQYGYAYYDFNLCKEEYLHMDESDYIDDNHLNKQGAEKITELVCGLMNHTVDVDELFEPSYETKIFKQENKVYGVQFLPIDEMGSGYMIVPVSNNENTYLFTIKEIDVTGCENVLQENAANNVIMINSNYNCKYVVEVMTNGILTNIAELDI